MGHRVCALIVSSSGDLSSWEETSRQRRLCSVPAYDQFRSLHWASLWCLVRLSCHAAESGRSPGGASVWSVSPRCLEPILLLEQGVGNDGLVLRTELQKQASVVIVVANSMST